jgi:hypothetical protein
MPPPVPRGGGKKPGGLFGAKGGGPKKKPGEKKPGGLFGGGKAKPKPAEDELPPAQPYEGPGFVVRQRAVCRIGFAMNTKPAKRPLKIGDVIQPIETRVNQQGVLRVHFADGWVGSVPVATASLVLGRGRGPPAFPPVLLLVVGPPDPPGPTRAGKRKVW